MGFSSPGRCLLERRNEGGLECRHSLLGELGVDTDGLDLSVAVHGHGDGAAAVRHLDALGGEGFLRRGDTALHLLCLFEEFADACHGNLTLRGGAAGVKRPRSGLEPEASGSEPRGVRPPSDLQIVGTFLAVRWEDGREDILPGELLRARSPSAENMGERDILGHLHGGEGPREFPGVAVTGLRRVGNYAVALSFSDGHATGIYSWDLLRALGDELTR